MNTFTTKTFMLPDGDQAVLLPDEIVYDDDVEVTITRTGDVVTVRPTVQQTPVSADIEGPVGRGPTTMA